MYVLWPELIYLVEPENCWSTRKQKANKSREGISITQFNSSTQSEESEMPYKRGCQQAVAYLISKFML